MKAQKSIERGKEDDIYIKHFYRKKYRVVCSFKCKDFQISFSTKMYYCTFAFTEFAFILNSLCQFY